MHALLAAIIRTTLRTHRSPVVSSQVRPFVKVSESVKSCIRLRKIAVLEVECNVTYFLKGVFFRTCVWDMHAYWFELPKHHARGAFCKFGPTSSKTIQFLIGCSQSSALVRINCRLALLARGMKNHFGEHDPVGLAMPAATR